MHLSSGHSFHIVDVSPWPLVGSASALLLTGGLVCWFSGQGVSVLVIGVTMTLLVMVQWWRDIIREGSFQGVHTTDVEDGLRYGMILFIVSEVMFFFSFFWSFFHSSLSPTVEVGGQWPPVGVEALNPFEVPLLNTMVLLASGVTVTWAHRAMIDSNLSQGVQSLLMTCSLGGYFTFLQGVEYLEAGFTIADSVYGSTFFVATGFHGLHVLIGATFLVVCLVRMKNFHFSAGHHFGFEAAAWYWHFVDVVWLFLFLTIYWWGGS